MIINPIKKTQVLFNKLKQTEDKEIGKRYSDANQLLPNCNCRHRYR
ncbi:hypothetical protein HNR41_002277 [Jeotgalicoccus coquinae]|uniref:Uncharacterized protein n=1 Tax=Jeotgalicoccus coquinae TaxID=709509 RepID=A0A6V7RRV8_9STAP|nr:hypothetical protein [Jeotgalicoccus coquinae]CAD2081636.1 hypothetical protein JEOCOQ751_02082 [Jeotgalicoccus coquinae]